MRRIVTYPNVASTLALLVALSGGAYAAGLVGTSDLKDGAVTTSKLHGSAVTAKKIQDGAVHAGKLATGSVGGRQLINGSVGSEEIAPGAIGPDALAPGAVDNGALAPEVTDTLASLADNRPYLTSSSNHVIQQVGSTSVDVASLTFPKTGTYLVVGSLRVFPRDSNPGHNLNCSMGGNGPSITNQFVPDNNGVEMVPLIGTTSAGAGTSVTLSCRQILGNGEITLSYDLYAVRVTQP